jgi:hypothetical protein
MYKLIKAEELPHLVLVPGEEHAHAPARPAGSWALLIGEDVAVHGTRDALMRAVDSIREELHDYYRAEHENGYHLRAPERECPECAPGEMACPECDNAEGNGWNGLWTAPADRVGCGACGHVWAPFAFAGDNE